MARYRLLGTGVRIYRMAVVGTKDQVQSADADTFFDSFKRTPADKKDKWPPYWGRRRGQGVAPNIVIAHAGLCNGSPRPPRNPAMLFQSETVAVEKDADGSTFLKIDVPGQTHNMISRQVLADLDAALNRVAAEPRLPLLVLRSGKPAGFLAGADLHGFLEIADEAAAAALSERGQRLFDKLAALPMPTLAAIHGPCLGGGLELALACDYRLVLDNPKTQLGLPEVTLGYCPAGAARNDCRASSACNGPWK